MDIEIPRPFLAPAGVSRSRPLNILWVIDHVCYDGSLHGGGRLFHDLIPAFDPAQVQVFPYFLRASEEVQRVFAACPVRVTTLNKGRYDPSTLSLLARLCRDHEIDVMHLFCYAASTFGRLASKVTGVPAVIHDFDTQIYFGYPLYLKLFDRLLAGATGHALAASPMCRDYMRDVRAVPGDRISIVPHAIPASRFEAAARQDRAAARRELGYADSDTIFAAVTKLGLDRGNEYLLRSFAQVAARHPDARLVIVYKPTYYHRVPTEYQHVEGLHDTARMRSELDAIIAELGIGARVRLHESLDHPDRYFAACDVQVAPFLHQRFSSVHLLEGLTHGRPAIATALGEVGELLTDGREGLLVPPGDEAALAAAMERLLADPALRSRMGQMAARLAEQYSVEASARRFADIYQRLSRRPAAEPALVTAG
jgi:glycosyltransferase involved in cell wall biosynthesis